MKSSQLIHYACYLLAVTFLSSLQSCHSDQNPDKSNHPNVILIVTDDQGWGDLGIHDNPFINTPNINQLASNSARFKRFYVSPVCSPTRAEILTGRYHPRSGVYSTSRGGERIHSKETLISNVFKSEDYNTAAFGKWHSGSQPPFHPNSRGFDEFYGFCSGHWGNYIDPMLEHNGQVTKGEGFIIDDLTNRTIEYIERSKNKPFFVHLAYNTPHSPMQVPDKWWNKYKDSEVKNNHRYSQKENKDKTRAAYALCENIDWNVGRLMDRLKELNQLENTIIIFMSDNGPNGWRWNGELKGIKGKTDEGGVLSPFFISWKDKIESQDITEIASAIDILPTLTDLSNISYRYTNALDGESLVPLLNNDNTLWKDRFVYSHWRGNISVRNQRFMLDHENQLFDLSTDAGQNNPLIGNFENEKSDLLKAKKNWTESVLTEMNENKTELIPVGFNGQIPTHLPARDGDSHGKIVRSNRWPNSSYFTNWTSLNDSITWNSEVMSSGNYKATLYLTCSTPTIGSVLELKQGSNSLLANINVISDSSPLGKEYDRVPREESYEQDFQVLEMGSIWLDKGVNEIVLKAKEFQNNSNVDFRLLILDKA